MAILPNAFSEFGADAPVPDKAAASIPQPPADAAADISLIAEIFVGAAKLFDPDPAAYTNADQVLYDLLKQMDDPHTADLIDIPYGMDGIFDPLPLFLQAAE